MNNHVFRPLFVAIEAVVLLLLFRHSVVPDDFGVSDNFTYGFHRAESIDDWKAVSVKYRGKAYCEECHSDIYDENMTSMHKYIQWKTAIARPWIIRMIPKYLQLTKVEVFALVAMPHFRFPPADGLSFLELTSKSITWVKDAVIVITYIIRVRRICNDLHT